MKDNNTNSLGTEPVGKLLFKLAMPAIASQIINLLYNIVDRMYIGHIPGIGKLALTGVGVCLPLIVIISAFAALVSMGGAPRASIFLGKGDKDSAEKTLGNCTTLLILLSVVLTIVFQLYADKMLMAFGASLNTIGYALEYIKIYSLGTVFVLVTLGLNAFISAQGFAKTSMMTVLIGAICNIILDPIFIFGFNMGVSGAALATIISQAVSMIWILIFLMGKKTTLRIQKKNLLLSAKTIFPCIALGLSPFVMQSTESLIQVCFNTSLLKYGGDTAVGAMTILTSVIQFSMLPLFGLTQGAQPIISYNFGARNAERIKKAFKLLIISCMTFSVLLWISVMLVPQVFVLIFNNDPGFVQFTSHALQIYMMLSFLSGIQIACQQTFLALGNAKCSLFLALLRKIFLLIPLIYIMPHFFADKTTAVFMAAPVADVIAITTTACLFTVQFKKALRSISLSNQNHK